MGYDHLGMDLMGAAPPDLWSLGGWKIWKCLPGARRFLGR